MRSGSSAQFSWLQICSFRLPGSSLNLACGSRLDLVQQSDAVAAAAAAWMLINLTVMSFVPQMLFGTRESRSSKDPWFPARMDELAFSPRWWGNTINSFWAAKCDGTPHFSSTADTEDRGHSWHFHPCRSLFGDQGTKICSRCSFN